jgi:transcriptional regulator with XRE-family HTH domain
VVEIGDALRVARERQGLELGEVERRTRIRARYLTALEEERFEQLPARAYAKGFLRGYAEFLGLDGRLIVAEFNARFPDDEQPELTPVRLRASPARIRRRRLTALLLAGVAVVAAGVLAWRFEASGGGPPSPAAQPTTTARVGRVPVAAPPVLRPPAPAASRSAHLVLRARGPCWLSIRAGSAAGPVLYEATLDAGGVLRYTVAPGRPRLWLRIGAPWNLELSLNGKPPASLPHVPSNILVTRGGVRSA